MSDSEYWKRMMQLKKDSLTLSVGSMLLKVILWESRYVQTGLTRLYAWVMSDYRRRHPISPEERARRMKEDREHLIRLFEEAEKRALAEAK